MHGPIRVGGSSPEGPQIESGEASLNNVGFYWDSAGSPVEVGRSELGAWCSGGR